MIRKLRQKFILITMVSMLIILVLVLGSVNIANMYQMNKEAFGMLEYLSNNNFDRMHNKEPMEEKQEPNQDGSQPEPAPGKNPQGDRPMAEMNPETMYTTRYFSVLFNNSGDIIRVDTEFIAAISKEQAQEYGYQALKSGKEKGYLGIYKYCVVEKPEGKRIVFLDCNEKIKSSMTVLLTSVVVGAVSYCVLFVLIAAMSRRAVQPVIENIEQQKRFVSDAGHELKTPLAIISANADVLSLTTPENQWICSIKNQTKRMDDLVKELLMLNRIEEKKEKKKFEEISLTEIAEDMVSSFQAVAQEKGKTLVSEVQQGIIMLGDKNEIRNIFSVLLDNAVKYALPESEIRVLVLKEKHKNKIMVKNQCEPITEGNLDNMFERFYRLDSSRSRETGGFGIGLSIAKEAVKLHRGSIKVDYSEKEGICFTVIL